MHLVHRARMADLEPARPTPSALRPGAGAGQARPDPCGSLQAAWRHPWLVGLAVALGVAGAYVYCRVAPPAYTSSAKLYVGDAATVLSGADDGGGGGDAVATGAYFSANTQAALMVSAPVLEAALATLDRERPLRQWAMFRDTSRPASLLKKEMIVEVGKKDGLVSLSLEAPDPTEAAALLNGVIGAYRESQKREAHDSAEDIRRILTDWKAAREKEMRQKWDQVLIYKKDSPDLALGAAHGGNIIVQRRALLAAALTEAQLELIEVQARAKRLPNKHTAMQMVEEAAEKERSTRAAFEAQEQKALAMSAREIEVAKLLSEIDYFKNHIAKLDDRIGLIGVNEDGGGLNVRVVEPAVPVTSPSSPKKMMLCGLGGALGLVVGGGCATLRESGRARRRIGAGWQLDTLLGLPVLATVPVMSGRQRPATHGRGRAAQSMSELVEAFRTLRTVVYFSVPREQCKTILITSPAERDGKSTLATGLAIAMARSGRRILLVDADLRKPTLHKIFHLGTGSRGEGAGEEAGLCGVLTGAAVVDEAIQATGVDNLDVLPCGPIPSNPSELLNDPQFYDLLKVLGDRYDHVVLDSTPVIPVADARIVGALCDVTILVLHARRSSPNDARYACDALTGLGARVLGIVMNGASAGHHDGQYGSPPSRHGVGVTLSPAAPHNGVGHIGSPHNGVGHNGGAHNGGAHNDASHNGVVHNGVAHHGVLHNGVAHGDVERNSAPRTGHRGTGGSDIGSPGDGVRRRASVVARVPALSPIVTRNGAAHFGGNDHENGDVNEIANGDVIGGGTAMSPNNAIDLSLLLRQPE